MENKAWLERYLLLLGSLIVLAVIALIGYMAITQVHPIEATVAPFVQALVSIVTLIVGYYWGSSSSSASKDKTLSDIATGGSGPSSAPVTSSPITSPDANSTMGPAATGSTPLPTVSPDLATQPPRPGWNPRPEA